MQGTDSLARHRQCQGAPTTTREVLDLLVQERRNKAATLGLLRKLLRNHGVRPRGNRDRQAGIVSCRGPNFGTDEPAPVDPPPSPGRGASDLGGRDRRLIGGWGRGFSPGCGLRGGTAVWAAGQDKGLPAWPPFT